MTSPRFTSILEANLDRFRSGQHQMTLLVEGLAPLSPSRPTSYNTLVGLYPPIVVLGALVTAATGLPVALGTLVTVTIVATLATYWVMPWITRVTRHWLYPQP